MSSVRQNELRSVDKISSGALLSHFSAASNEGIVNVPQAQNTDLFYIHWSDDSLDELFALHNFLQQEAEYQLAMLCDAIGREYRARNQLAALLDSNGAGQPAGDDDSDIEVIAVKPGKQPTAAEKSPFLIRGGTYHSSALVHTNPIVNSQLSQWRQSFEKGVNDQYKSGHKLLNRHLLKFHMDVLKQIEALPEIARNGNQIFARIRAKYALGADLEGRTLLVRRKCATQRFVPREEWFDELFALYRQCCMDEGEQCAGAHFFAEVRNRFANLGKMIVRMFLRTGRYSNVNGCRGIMTTTTRRKKRRIPAGCKS